MSDIVKSLPKKIKVSFADLDVDIKPDENNYGEFDATSNTIRISPDITQQDLANTLIHELLHAAVWYGGLKDEGSVLENDKHEENVVNVLANQLSQILKDNPKVMTALRKGFSKKNGGQKTRKSVVATPQKILEKYVFHKNRK